MRYLILQFLLHQLFHTFTCPCPSHPFYLWFHLETLETMLYIFPRREFCIIFPQYLFFNFYKIKWWHSHPHNCTALIGTQDSKVKFHFLLLFKWFLWSTIYFSIKVTITIHAYISLNLATEDNTKCNSDDANILNVLTPMKQAGLTWGCCIVVLVSILLFC